MNSIFLLDSDLPCPSQHVPCVCAGGTGRQTLQVTLPSEAENKTPVSFGADYTKDSLEGLDHMSFEHVQTLCSINVSTLTIGSDAKGGAPDESRPSSKTR